MFMLKDFFWKKNIWENRIFEDKCFGRKNSQEKKFWVNFFLTDKKLSGEKKIMKHIQNTKKVNNFCFTHVSIKSQVQLRAKAN